MLSEVSKSYAFFGFGLLDLVKVDFGLMRFSVLEMSIAGLSKFCFTFSWIKSVVSSGLMLVEKSLLLILASTRDS